MKSLARLLAGVALAWCVALGVAAPETRITADLAVLAVALLTAWRLAYGLGAVALLAPAGTLLTPPPVRVGELVAWAFIAILLVRTWRRRRDAGIDVQSEARAAAWLFGACVVASWAGLVVAGAAGVEPGAVPSLLAHTVRPDHLLYSSAEPETWTMLQAVAGLALFGAAMHVAQRDSATARIVAWALVASGVLLAIATELDVLRQWSGQGYGGWFLWRYVRGERFSLHLADLNAAGSQYVLAALAATALAVADRARRWMWIAAVAIVLPALWLTGSRSAVLGAIVVGATVIPLARRHVRVQVTRAGTAAIVALAIGATGATMAAAGQSAEQGSAMSALRMRSEFLVTSARMFASAPVFGVGVGHYHERSAEFMPPSLRAVYPFENAHNYFAQQFAELGIVGGLLFLWLVVAGVRMGWKSIAGRAVSAPQLALVSGSIGYLLTCVTGHPLLVPEAALPFWAVFGVMIGETGRFAAGAARDASGVRRPIAAAIVIVLLLAGVVLQARRYAQVTAPPSEQGFHETQTSSDGTRFNWMTRHGVFYIGSQPGFLVLPLRAPDLPSARPAPFAVDIQVGGRAMGRYTIEPGRWNEIRIALRDRARTRFRRVDLRANQYWTRRHDLGLRDDDVDPRSVMVGEIRWQPAGGR